MTADEAKYHISSVDSIVNSPLWYANQTNVNMDSDMKNEDILMRIRSTLNSEQIKLWQEPYYQDNVGPCLKEMKLLATKYAGILGIPEEEITHALEELQKHSIQRARANNEFKETGVALLRFKVPPRQDKSRTLNLQIKLNVSGNELIETVASQLAIEPIRVKLIHQGRVVKRDLPLSGQGIKNGAQILVVLLAESPESLRKDSDLYSVMQTARHDAELLSENADNDFGHYMQLEDQSGNTLVLPAAERKALTVAMTLHERGRKELKEDNYPLALVLLLEADKHFSECNAQILKSVDNYALLNLDIAWCYLNLRSITYIPDAEARLGRCEDTFHSSYGPNMERLIALKGTSANEQALLMRLHLLQAIVLYHQNRRSEARSLLGRAESELHALKVDTEAVAGLMQLGASPGEARMGLRTTGNDVQAAYTYIMNAREQREQARKKAKEEQKSRAFGKCIDGKQYVSAPFVKMLQDMGYPRNTAILALKNSNNHVSNAVQIILEQPQLLKEEDLPRSLSSHSDMFVDEQSLETLLGLGFDRDTIQSALRESENHLDKAADILINAFQGSSNGAGTSTSTAQSSGHSEDVNRFTKNLKMQKEVKAAFERLSEGMDIKDDDYLDLTLNQEEDFLKQYKDLLE